MKKANDPTVKKSMRIPKSVADEIKKEAARTNQSFTDVFVYRVQHFKAPLTPAIMTKVQDIANTAIGTVRDSDPDKADDIERKVDELWNFLK